MRGRERGIEAPGFENSPAYRFAEAIHAKNRRHLMVFQYASTPLGLDSTGTLVEVDFESRNKPWHIGIKSNGIEDLVDISHRIILIRNVDDLLETSVEVVIGTDNIVRRIDYIENEKTYEDPDTRVSVMGERAIASFTRDLDMSLSGGISEYKLHIDSLLTPFDGFSDPSQPTDVQRLKRAVDEVSRLGKTVISNVDLAGSSHRILTMLEKGKPTVVEYERATEINDNYSKRERWGFYSKLPSTFSEYDIPTLSSSVPMEELMEQGKLAWELRTKRTEAQETGGDVALKEDLEKGLKMLRKLARSWRKKYEKEESVNLDII